MVPTETLNLKRLPPEMVRTAPSDDRQLPCSRFRRTPTLRKFRVKKVVPILVQVQQEQSESVAPRSTMAHGTPTKRLAHLVRANRSTPARLLRRSSMPKSCAFLTAHFNSLLAIIRKRARLTRRKRGRACAPEGAGGRRRTREQIRRPSTLSRAFRWRRPSRGICGPRHLLQSPE
jgi:hypothetical protein